MKTQQTPSFSNLKNNYLTQLLPQLIKEYVVVQLFYTPQTKHEPAQLVVHLKIKNEVDVLQNQKWVKKARVSHNLNVYFFYSFQLQMLYNAGNPFIAAYCNASTLLYTNPEANTTLETDHKWKRFKKKLNRFQESFYHDHELLRSQIQPLVTADCAAAVLFQYESLLAYDLEFLEALYNGVPSQAKSLHERIAALIPFVPEIQQYFVKDKRNGYYLTTLIEKAKEASLDMECYFASEHYEAFHLAEAGLFELIKQRLKALKQRVKGTKRNPLPADPMNGLDKNPELPERAMAVLQKIITLEEVYLFHHTVYGETQTFYLLLIGQRLCNTYLKDLTAQLNAASGAGREYMLIGHTRQWIQEWLYSYQSFFCQIIKKEKLVFASMPYHADPHWEVPYTPEYPELEHYFDCTEEVYNQFLFMADCDNDNYQGVANLFSLFFLCFCRTYLYASLSYYPNCLNSTALWQLCLYANPDLRRYDYLFKGFGAPFFEFLDHYRTVLVMSAFAFDEKRKGMLKISEGLMGELEGVVLSSKDSNPTLPGV